MATAGSQRKGRRVLRISGKNVRYMKGMIRSLILVLLTGIPTFVCGQTEAWNQALAHFRAGQYNQAAGIWDSIAVTEPSAAVWYNLGNTWYKKGDIPRSILYFERAIKWDPGHRNAKENLAVALQRIDDPVLAVRPFFLARWWHAIVQPLGPNAWAALFLISITALVLYILAWYAGRLTRMSGRWSGFIVLFLLVVLTAFAADHRYRLRTDQTQAIAMPSRVSLFTSPDEMSPVLREFPGGTKLRILEELSGWYRVRLPNMEQGWVMPQVVERI